MHYSLARIVLWKEMQKWAEYIEMSRGLVVWFTLQISYLSLQRNANVVNRETKRFDQLMPYNRRVLLKSSSEGKFFILVSYHPERQTCSRTYCGKLRSLYFHRANCLMIHLVDSVNHCWDEKGSFERSYFCYPKGITKLLTAFNEDIEALNLTVVKFRFQFSIISKTPRAH